MGMIFFPLKALFVATERYGYEPIITIHCFRAIKRERKNAFFLIAPENLLILDYVFVIGH
jgi:hypothetical protein